VPLGVDELGVHLGEKRIECCQQLRAASQGRGAIGVSLRTFEIGDPTLRSGNLVTTTIEAREDLAISPKIFLFEAPLSCAQIA
jgi:hypothetical protein